MYSEKFVPDISLPQFIAGNSKAVQELEQRFNEASTRMDKLIARIKALEEEYDKEILLNTKSQRAVMNY